MNEEYMKLIDDFIALKRECKKHGLLLVSFDTEFMKDIGYNVKPHVAVELLEDAIDEMHGNICDYLEYKLD